MKVARSTVARSRTILTNTWTLFGMLVYATVLFSFKFVTGWEQYLYFSDTELVYSVNRDHSYILSWNGQRHFKRSVVTFSGSDSSRPQDRYKICIQAKQWILLVAGITIKYYTGTGTSANYKKSLNGNSGDNLKEWCTEESKFLHVELTTPNKYYPQGLVHLHVRAVRTSHYQNFKETIVVAIIGMVAYLILIAIVWVLRRQQHIQRSSYGNKSTAQKLGNFSHGQSYITDPSREIRPYYSQFR